MCLNKKINKLDIQNRCENINILPEFSMELDPRRKLIRAFILDSIAFKFLAISTRTYY